MGIRAQQMWGQQSRGTGRSSSRAWADALSTVVPPSLKALSGQGAERGDSRVFNCFLSQVSPPPPSLLLLHCWLPGSQSISVLKWGLRLTCQLDKGLVAETMWRRVAEQESLPGQAWAIFLLLVTLGAFSSVLVLYSPTDIFIRATLEVWGWDTGREN